MTDPSTNPFVLPGMGQNSDLSGNPLLASMEMMRQAWAGLAGPGGLAQSLPMTSLGNVEELERRITELRSVESWLRMNLSVLSSTIQGMEVQRSTITTLRAFVDNAASMGAAAEPGQPTPLEVVLGLKPAPGKKPADRPDSAAAAAEPPAQADGQPGGGQAVPGAQALNDASQAWWNLLQQQFNNIAQATAASMGPAGGEASVPPTPAPAAPAASATSSASSASATKAARKAPAKRAAPRKTASKPSAGKA